MSEEKTINQQIEEILEKLQKDYPIEDDVQFNEFDIQEKLQKHAFLLSSYHQKLENEKFQLEKLKMLLDKVQGEAFEKIQKESDIMLRTAEIEKYYLPRDPKVKKVKEMIMKQQFVVNYFDICVKSVGAQGWNMKNFLESRKY